MIGSHPKCPRRCLESNRQIFKDTHQDGQHEVYQLQSFLRNSNIFLDRHSSQWQSFEKQIILMFKKLRRELDELEQNILNQITDRKIKSAIESEEGNLILVAKNIIKKKIDNLYCDEIYRFIQQKDKIEKNRKNQFLVKHQKDLHAKLNQNLKSLLEKNIREMKIPSSNLIDDPKKMRDFQEKQIKEGQNNQTLEHNRKTNANDLTQYSKRGRQQNWTTEGIPEKEKGKVRQNEDRRQDRRQGRRQDRRQGRRQDRRQDRRYYNRDEKQQELRDQRGKGEREVRNQQKQGEKKEAEESRNTNNRGRRDNRRNRGNFQQNKDQRYNGPKKMEKQENEQQYVKKKLIQLKNEQNNFSIEVKVSQFVKSLKHNDIWIVSDGSKSAKLVAPRHQYLKEGNQVLIINCFSRQFQGEIEVHMSRDGIIKLLRGELANLKQKQIDDHSNNCKQFRKPKGESRLIQLSEINPNLQGITILVFVVSLEEIKGGYFCRLADESGVVSANLRQNILIRQNASLFIRKINPEVVDGHIILQADEDTVVSKARHEKKNINLKNDVSARFYEEVDD